MRLIYQEASEVLLWLGNASEDGDLAMDIVATSTEMTAFATRTPISVRQLTIWQGMLSKLSSVAHGGLSFGTSAL